MGIPDKDKDMALALAMGIDTSFIDKGLVEIEKKIDDFTKGINSKEVKSVLDSVLGNYGQNITRLSSVQKELANVIGQIKLLDKAEKENGASVENAAQRRANLLAQEMELRQSKRELVAMINAEIRAMQSADGSIENVAINLVRLSKAYDQLNAEERKSSFGESLAKQMTLAEADLIRMTSILQKAKVETVTSTAATEKAGGAAKLTGKGFDSLGMSVQQVARELPSVTMGANMFFLAISNNVPILADNIQRAKKEYAELIAQGKQATPVGRQILSSILSWQTAMVISITLLTAYGKELSEWVGGLMDADKANNALKKSIADLNTSIYKEQGAILSLFSRLKQATQGSSEYQKIKDEIISKYGTYLNGLDKEVSSLRDIEKAYLAVSQAALKSAKDRAIAKVSETAEEDYAKFWEENIPKVTDVLKKQGYTKDQIARYLQYLYSGVGNKYGEFNFMSRDVFKEDQSILNKIQVNRAKFYKQIQDINENFDFGDNDIVQSNKEHLETIRKNLVDELNKMGESAAKSKTGEAIKKQIQDIDKRLKDAWDFKDNSKAAQTSAEKAVREVNALKEANEKVSTLKAKLSTEQQRLEQDLANETKQAEINTFKDGLAKTLAQRSLDNKKELEAITREKDDKIKAYIQAQKELFDAQEDAKAKGNKKYKKQTFNASSVDTSGINKQYVGITSDTEAKQSREYLDLLLSNYKDYSQQRVDIEQKLNDDLAQLQAERQKAIEKGDIQTSDALSRAIAKATTDKAKSLMSFDFERLKESPDYVRAFEDLKNTSSETLNSLFKQLEDAKATAAQVLNPQDLKDYTTAIQNIMDELDYRNPFQALADKQKALAEAEKELAAAKKQLDYVNAGGKIVTGSTSTKNEDGSLNITNTYKSQAQALEEYRKAKDGVVKANNNFVKAEKAAADHVSDLANSIKEVGSAIGGTAGEILSFIGDIMTFATTSMEGIQKVSSATSTAVSAVEKASVILAIISAAIQLMQKLDELLGDSHSQYEKYAEKVDEINKLTDAVNEYRFAVLEANQQENNWFGQDKLKSLKDFKDVQIAVLQAIIDKENELQSTYQNESGSGWGKYVSQVYYAYDKITNSYKEAQSKAIENLRIETRKKSSGFLGSGVGGRSQQTEDLQTWINNNKDLFKGLDTNLFTSDGLVNSNLVSTILDKYGDKLVGQTKETLEALKELQDKYDEYLEKLHEYVANLYDPLVNNFVDSMWDWFDSGKDALDSFKSYASDTFRDIVSDMLKTIILKNVVGSFQDDISALYDKYALGTITEDALMKQVAVLTQTLVGNYSTNVPTIESMLTEIGKYFSTAGIDLSASSSSQSSTYGSSTSMNQDTGDLIVGRSTAILESGVRREEQNDEIIAILKLANSNANDIKGYELEIAENVLMMRQDISDMSINMTKLVINTNKLHSIDDKLEKIEKNTRQL